MTKNKGDLCGKVYLVPMTETRTGDKTCVVFMKCKRDGFETSIPSLFLLHLVTDHFGGEALDRDLWEEWRLCCEGMEEKRDPSYVV